MGKAGFLVLSIFLLYFFVFLGAIETQNVTKIKSLQ